MKNKFLWLAACCLLLTQSLRAQTSNPGEATELVTENGNLKGALLIPAGAKKMPVVLLISGSGPTDRDGNNPAMKNNSLRMVAEALQAQGIASLRYDKRGIAESKAAGLSEADLRFDQYVQDATAWTQKLKQDKRFNKVIILGHSEGSLIGMIAAREAKANGLISVAGAGQSADKVIREQLAPQPQMVKDMAFPVLDQLVLGQTVADVNPMMASLFRPSVQPYLISWFKLDPQVELKKLTIPVLLVQGNQDIQVGMQEAKRLAEAQPKAKLLEINGMNHVLKEIIGDRTANIATYSNPTLPLAPELMPALVNFIKGLN
ncbi:alpha/beta hydrolase [Rufibacter soli]|jgi:uncharacterized protein